MAPSPNIRVSSKVLLHTLVCSLLGAVISRCSQEDIDCLKSIKESLEDPHHYLKSSWKFDNYTEGFICRFVGVDCWHLDENKVLSIRLSGMGLKGQFPRGIRHCPSLSAIDLSNNQLSGPIPSDIETIFTFGTSLDLSSNNFSGNIPKQISNCSFLNLLRLDNNQLTGLIPPELALLTRIRNFSVANNQLHGAVPNFTTLLKFNQTSFAGNPGLCGFPLDPCHEDERSYFIGLFKKGFGIGYGVSFVSVLAISWYYYVLCILRNERKIILPRLTLLKRQHSLIQRKKLQLLHLLHEASIETSMLVELVTKMSYADLSEATNHFSADNIIGSGRMGTTYKGNLPNGWVLAIKRLFDTQKFDEHFITELKTLGRLRHDNLVPLLGFCAESKEKLLVYKYMSNGNLYDWLHPSQGEAKVLEWPLRLKIALGIARGLVWLHQNYNMRVVHLDICSNCILLDQNFQPKISNFGEAILIKSNNTDWSSSFYIDTEFWELSFVKEDVYRFGILLLELTTGQDPSQLINSSNTGDEGLAKWAIDLSSSFDVKDVIDKSLIGRGFDIEIFQIFRVGCNCVQLNPDRRPTMLEVHKAIRAVGQRYGLELESGSRLTNVGMADECKEVEITEISSDSI